MQKAKRHLLPVLLLFAVSFTFSLTTYFGPYSRETYGHDAGIFAYVGYAITQGRMPYTGAWDNKGPLLYLINALGISLNYRYGIYVLELMTLFVLLLFLYKTALLFTSRWIAVICAVFCVLPLTVTLEGGNLSEEYSLPFTAAGFYFIAKFFKNQYHLPWYEMMITGACIAAVFLLRLNILAFFFCAVLGVIIALIRSREFKTLGRVFAFSILGFFLLIAPVLIYLVRGGALSDCINTAYLGVLGSFSDQPLMQSLQNVANMVFQYISSGGFFLIIFFVAVFPFYVWKNRGEASPLRSLLWVSFFAMFVNLLANSLSGACQMHYFMTFIPIALIPAVWLAETVRSYMERTSHDRLAGHAVVAAIALLLCMPGLPQLKDNFFSMQRDGTGSYLSYLEAKVANYLTEHTEPDDLVEVIGDQSAVTSYYHAKRLAASNYFYYANGRFSEEAKNFFADEILGDLAEESPKLIMFSAQGSFDDFTGHLSAADQWTKLLESDYIQRENDFGYIIYDRIGG